VKAPAQFSAAQWLILLVTLACVALTASLGAWQMRRAAYKEQLAEQILKQNQQTALTNSALNAMNSGVASISPPPWLHRRAELQGRWLHEHTVFLDNRPMQVQGSQRVGFYVVTPLALEGSPQVLWVQRGWVQRDFQDRSRLPALPESREIFTVQGRLMSSVSRAYEMKASEKENSATASASNSPRPSRIWQNLPSVDLGSKTLLPMTLLQTTPEAGSDSLLRDWPAADTGVAKHHGYAFQWFALSALLVILYVWFQLIAPRRHKREV
jgi:surfeit locus 1 family protein